MEDHPSHEWRYSDSSYYDFVCKKCGCAEFSAAARLPCTPIDIGATISEETQKNIKAIEDNTRYAMMNAHKFWCD